MPDLNLPPIDPSALDAYLAGNPPDGRFTFAEPAPEAIVIDLTGPQMDALRAELSRPHPPMRLMPRQLPIDVAVPDPVPVGDPWPYHLCMPSVDWPEPVGPVLRRDRGGAPLALQSHAAAVRAGVDRARLALARHRAALVPALVWVVVLGAVVLAARFHPAFNLPHALLP